MKTTSRSLSVIIALATLVSLAATAPSAAIGRVGVGQPPLKIESSTVKALEVAPTGEGASEEQCKRYEVAINSWREEVLDRVLAGDNKGADKAERNQKALQNEATDAGCFIIY